MSDNKLRHFTATSATLICALAFFAGYYAGPRGWWWAVFSVFIIYGMIYKVIDR